MLVGGAIFGHDHDVNHDIGHDHDGGGNEPTVSIFSLKVIGTFIMGFGGGGAIGRYGGGDMLHSSFIGLVVGLLMGLFMYFVMRLLYGQQSTSLVDTNSVIGKTGTVVIGIDSDKHGQVKVFTGTEAPIYLARGPAGKNFAKGTSVTVISTNGAEIVVDTKN
jgi:membrane protein implicated in regulation of membrane protease activity